MQQHQSVKRYVIVPDLPAWVPRCAEYYLAHTEVGLPIRELARSTGNHASTILRQIRRIETRRDDPLVDAALRKLGQGLGAGAAKLKAITQKEDLPMSALLSAVDEGDDAPALTKDAVRVLRRLCETGAVLAVAVDMDKAVVVREGPSGRAGVRTAVVDRKLAEALALKDWIGAERAGRVTRYRITTAGRAALEEMMVDAPDLEAVETEADATQVHGFAEAQTEFADQHRDWGEKSVAEPDTGRMRKIRYNLAESPLTALARRRDKNGEPFLSDDMVSAGERLREDFELAQMGPRVAQNWDRFLTGGGDRGSFGDNGGPGNGPERARRRVADALGDLGPGLADVVLRCCCFLEGLETTEKRLGWSARSGKIVLRIALIRLKRHYDETTGPGGGLIG